MRLYLVKFKWLKNDGDEILMKDKLRAIANKIGFDEQPTDLAHQNETRYAYMIFGIVGTRCWFWSDQQLQEAGKKLVKDGTNALQYHTHEYYNEIHDVSRSWLWW
jgi:hypothetical protein